MNLYHNISVHNSIGIRKGYFFYIIMTKLFIYEIYTTWNDIFATYKSWNLIFSRYLTYNTYFFCPSVCLSISLSIYNICTWRMEAASCLTTSWWAEAAAVEFVEPVLVLLFLSSTGELARVSGNNISGVNLQQLDMIVLAFACIFGWEWDKIPSDL